MTKIGLASAVALFIVSLGGPRVVAAKTCAEGKTELAAACITERGLDAAKTCRAEAEARLSKCQDFHGEMGDFSGQAKAGRNDADGNVYQTCSEKRRSGYVLERNEMDLCGGLPRR